MTVSTAAAKAGPYDGNDVTTSFAFAFKVFADSNIRVIETVVATEVETDLVLNTNYTVTRNLDQDNNPGGSITYVVAGVPTALPSTKKLTIVGNFAIEQPTDIPNGGSFFAQIVENALDRLTLIAKQLRVDVDRAVKVDISSDTDPSELIAQITQSVADAEAAADSSAGSAGSSATSAASAAASLAAISPETIVRKTSDTGAAYIPGGTTAQRPPLTSGQYGIRYSETLLSYEGWNGTGWGSIGGGATGGVGNPAFYENDITITQSYTITSGKNAVSAGPITIASGAVVTVPSGSVWTIVGV